MSWPATSVEARRSAPPEERAVVGGTETILLAEDEPEVRTGVVHILENAGYRVIVATDGEEAVQLFDAHRSTIAAALLDVVMPRMGGPTVVARIREMRPQLPIVLSSGYDANEIGSDPPANVLRLDKPYKPDALLRIMRQAIDGD